jgi:hypothetical protein
LSHAAAGAWVEGAVGFDDVVFRLGTVGPAVDCEVGAAGGGIGGGVSDGAGTDLLAFKLGSERAMGRTPRTELHLVASLDPRQHRCCRSIWQRKFLLLDCTGSLQHRHCSSAHSCVQTGVRPVLAQRQGWVQR